MNDKTRLTNAYATHGELSEIQATVADERKGLRANHWAQQFFTVTTWIIYLLFAAAMYAAPLWVLQSFFGANSGNFLAIAVIGVFLVVFPTALALGKHAGYRALSKRGIDPRYMGAIIAFFIASGIYFEMTSASSQQQEKAHQAVENSNAGKSIMGTTISTGTGTNAALIADAEYKLVACQRRVSEGKTKDCKNSQARVDSLKEQSSADRAAAVTANSAAITAKQSALEKERESHALPIAKSFSELLGATVATGAVIAALIAALIFEISHSLTIYNEWRLSREIAALEVRFKGLKIDYFHQTGKQFDTTDFKEDEVINLVEMRQNGKIEHFNDRLQDDSYPSTNDGGFKKSGIGFNAEINKTSFGFIPDRGTTDSQDVDNRRKYPQTILYPTGGGKTANDYATIPRKDFKRPSSTAGTATAEPLEQTVYTALEQPNDDTGTPADRAAFEAHNDLYPRWRAAVNSGEIAATARACRDFVVKHRGDDVLSMRQAKYIWNAWGKKAVGENVLSLNPEYLPGNRKLKYLKAA
jgi:hypothetical protein